MANKKSLKRTGRKILSLLLTLTMVTGMLQVGAASYPNQVMDGHFAVNAAGEVSLAESGTVTEDGFTLSKTIRQTGLDAFEITLSVQTSQTIITDTVKSATVLVIDLSNSMNYSLGSSTRMEEAKRVAKEFLASYAGTDPNAQQNISVVWFGSGSGVDKDWVNVAGGEGQNSYNDIYSYLNTLQAPHRGDEGGTNLEAGLAEALAQLELRTDASELKNVVLLTDGKPTYRIGGGNGSSGSAANNNAAAAQAEAIKQAGATLYTVCIAAESDVCYEGTDVHVCEHCEQTRDQHIRHEVCSRCGAEHSEHEAVSSWGRTYYRCPGSRDSYYRAQTYYFCDESLAVQYRDKVISGDVTVGYFLSNDIATSPDTSFNANTTDELDEALKAIAAKISESGYTGEGTSVTDPMGQFISLANVPALNTENISVENGVINWTLDPEKAQLDVSADGQTRTYTYSITYPIVLDTAAEGFVEANEDGSTKYYPTNGYTYLSVPQEDGSSKKIAFPVPGVCGEVPSVHWSIEYYLQEDAPVGQLDEYTLDDTDSNLGPVKLWTSVEAPAGYEVKYRADNYEFEAGSTKLEITPTGENVMKLYYKHITAPVTVNHFYKTDVILADGTEIPGEHPAIPQKSYGYTRNIETVFQATPEAEFDQATYRLEQALPSDRILVSIDGQSNVIDLYYTRLVDERAVTSARVDHIYTTYAYELQDGRYVLVQQGEAVTEIAEQAAEIRATTVFNVSDQPLPGYGEFELDPEKGDYAELLEDGMRFTVKEDPADNIRTLYFEKIVDEREETEVTVNHYYTKTVTAVEDGQVITRVDPNRELGHTSTESAYIGESFQASQINGYQGDVYVSDPGNAAKLTIDALTGPVTIDLYYTLEQSPEQTSLIVNHIWRTFTEVTVELTEDVEKEIEVEVTDPETGEVSTVIETVTETVVTGTKTEIRTTEDHTDLNNEVSGLYEGQRYTAPKLSWGEGYVFNEEDSNDTGIAGTNFELTLYYDKWADADERQEASIEVQHIYTTYLETIVDGKVEIVTVADGTRHEAHGEYLAGDEFTATAQPAYNGGEYTQITDEAALGPVILQPGTNATIVIEYERRTSDLVDTNYTVSYEYRTYTMTVNADGVAGYYDAPAVAYGEPVSGSGYAGQIITFGDGARDGFDPLPGNPAVTQTLKAEGNQWTFIYQQYIPLEKGSVAVNHHYSLETIAIDGTSSWSSSVVAGAPVEMYLGESFTAQPVLNGYDRMDSILDGAAFPEPYALTVSGDHVVDFHYKKVVDNSVLAPYTITHRYYLYDWDGTLISGPAEDQQPSITGTGYVTTTISASPEPNGYEMTSASYNGEELGRQEGSAYTITLQDGSNNVVFVYEKTLPRDLLNVTVIHNYYRDEAALLEGAEPLAQYRETISNIPEGDSYTAGEHEMDGYTFHSAQPGDMTVRVTDQADHVIFLNYVRSSAEYKVVHIYSTNGRETGRTSETFAGLDGDVITADSIDRVTRYNGRTYRFVSISGDITLDTDEMQTITLRYSRSVTPTPEPEPQPPVNPPVEPPVEPEIPDEPIDIPDEEPPLADLPDEDVPLADVPQTGDPMALYVALATVSGLAGLGLKGKKKEDEE